MAGTFDGSTPTFDSGTSTFDGYSPSITTGGLNMSQIFFGAGALFGTPLTNYAVTAVANPTPVKFGILQDISLDVSFDVKMLYGASQFPFAVARGKGKISGKASFAQINAQVWNSLVFAQGNTANLTQNYEDLIGSVVPATPYQITPTPPSSGTWSQDLGVRGPGGVDWQRVASAPATGQYSVAAGVYTFAAADTGLTMFISYQYTTTAANSVTNTVNNVAMGQTPTFRADMSLPYGSKQLLITLPNCISTKLSFASKLDDFGIPAFDFEAFADGNNRVLIYSIVDQ